MAPVTFNNSNLTYRSYFQEKKPLIINGMLAFAFIAGVAIAISAAPYHSYSLFGVGVAIFAPSLLSLPPYWDYLSHKSYTGGNRLALLAIYQEICKNDSTLPTISIDSPAALTDDSLAKVEQFIIAQLQGKNVTDLDLSQISLPGWPPQLVLPTLKTLDLTGHFNLGTLPKGFFEKHSQLEVFKYDSYLIHESFPQIFNHPMKLTVIFKDRRAYHTEPSKRVFTTTYA